MLQRVSNDILKKYKNINYCNSILAFALNSALNL